MGFCSQSPDHQIRQNSETEYKQVPDHSYPPSAVFATNYCLLTDSLFTFAAKPGGKVANYQSYNGTLYRKP